MPQVESLIARAAYHRERAKREQLPFVDIFEWLEEQVAIAVVRSGDNFSSAEYSPFFKIPDVRKIDPEIMSEIDRKMAAEVWVMPGSAAERLKTDCDVLREVGLESFLPDFIKLLDLGETEGRERGVLVPNLPLQGWCLVDVLDNSLPEFMEDYRDDQATNRVVRDQLETLIATLQRQGIHISVERVWLGQRFKPDTGKLEKKVFLKVIDPKHKPLISQLSYEEPIASLDLLQTLGELVAPLRT